MSHAQLIERVGDAIEIAGVALIVLGLLFAAWRGARGSGAAAARGTASVASRVAQARHDMGRAILLGLEVLVAADIVRTVAFTPTLASVTVLAIVVAIRTFLSWSLALELDGRWPWQRGTAHQP
jgi:uncharacterized membrane protein